MEYTWLFTFICKSVGKAATVSAMALKKECTGVMDSTVDEVGRLLKYFCNTFATAECDFWFFFLAVMFLNIACCEGGLGVSRSGVDDSLDDPGISRSGVEIGLELGLGKYTEVEEGELANSKSSSLVLVFSMFVFEFLSWK